MRDKRGKLVRVRDLMESENTHGRAVVTWASQIAVELMLLGSSHEPFTLTADELKKSAWVRVEQKATTRA